MKTRPPLLVYLDQHCWTRLFEDEPDTFLWLEELVLTERVIVPFSQVHLVETFKAVPSTSLRILESAQRLTANRGLVGAMRVLALEADRHRHRRHVDWLRERLLTTSFLDLFSPPEAFFDSMAGFLTIETALALLKQQDMSSMGLRASVDLLLQKGAEAHNLGQQPLLDLDSMVQEKEGLPDDPIARRAVFPSFIAREALHAARVEVGAKRFEPNDLLDFTFLGVTLPYFDCSVVDNTMHKVASYAIRKLGAPVHRYPSVVELGALRKVVLRILDDDGGTSEPDR